jgi:hypothetical protein
MVILTAVSFSCTAAQKTDSNGNIIKKRKPLSLKTGEIRLKGTTSEIMNAFKGVLSRYEFEEFSRLNLNIVTKIKKLDKSSPYYDKYINTGEISIYEQYRIGMRRDGRDIVVKYIKYSILVQEMDMKTNRLGYKEIARLKEAENELLEKVKRLLYRY